MKTKRKLLLIPIALLLLCLLSTVTILIANFFLPTGSEVVDRLSAAEKARLAEALHLRRTVGAAAWPGWDEADIPLVVYNEAYAFLVGHATEPPAGWQPVPGNGTIGSPWERVPDDTFFDEPYYRSRLPDQDVTPQAFTIRIGDAWVASMPTKEWAEIRLAGEFRQDLPGFLRSIFPYGPVVRLFLGGSEKYITLLLHESFHAFEGMVASERLVRAERAGRRFETEYPWHDAGLEQAWQAELDLLADAARQSINGASAAEIAALAQQFLDQRAARRQAARLSPHLVAYEQQREWVEGQAKYMELTMWRLGVTTAGYRPHPDVAALDDFEAYQDANTAWSREIDQIRRMASDEGDGRFYYSGLAQAVLLDRLLPGWKEQAMDQDVFLENLLAQSVKSRME